MLNVDTQILELLNICLYVILLLTAAVKIPVVTIKRIFIVCILISLAWHIQLPQAIEYNESWQLFSLEISRYLIWSLLLLSILLLSRAEKIASPLSYSVGFVFLLALSFSIFTAATPLVTISSITAFLYLKILFCLINIILSEQVIRHDHSSRMAKLIALVAITLFAYDIFYYANRLLFLQSSEELVAVRSLLSSFSAVIMATSIIFYADLLKEAKRFKFSNSVIIFNSSLIFVGLFLILMSAISTLISAFNLPWTNVLQIFIYIIALFFVVTISFSEKIRRNIIVFLSKHFFAHKYDYKDQWTKLDSLLSSNQNDLNCYDKSLKSLLQLFSCSSGALWLKGEQFFALTATQAFIPTDDIRMAHNDSEFISILENQEWIFQLDQKPNSFDKKYNAILPKPYLNIAKAWVILPLNTPLETIGFVVLNEQKYQDNFTWEDIDLLKLAGRQVASYIRNQQQAEKINQNQQFDMFNKVSAFAIHDIKNLIAQQGLVVKNAEKHKHNPDFIDDAINTISQSVAKMDRLLIKLQGNHQKQTEKTDLKLLLNEAIAMNSHEKPIPNLELLNIPPVLEIDREKLLMAVNHLIKNAQDATDEQDTINISLQQDDSYVCLDIADTGTGMTEQFVKEELFKPFKSTKQDKGMGIGAFQIKELIHSLSGELFVESTPNIGSKFSIYLPISKNNNHRDMI